MSCGAGSPHTLWQMGAKRESKSKTLVVFLAYQRFLLENLVDKKKKTWGLVLEGIDGGVVKVVFRPGGEAPSSSSLSRFEMFFQTDNLGALGFIAADWYLELFQTKQKRRGTHKENNKIRRASKELPHFFFFRLSIIIPTPTFFSFSFLRPPYLLSLSTVEGFLASSTTAQSHHLSRVSPSLDGRMDGEETETIFESHFYRA